MLKSMVNQIFHEKLMNVQRKIPVKLNIPEISTRSFNEVLNAEIHTEQKINSLNNHSNLSGSNSFDNIISEASSKFNISESIIKSVISAESNFNPDAMSSVGAKGLMQLMPLTAEYLGVKNSWDPKQNIEGGTKYLRELMDRYDGNIKLALAAYNAGPGNVDKYNGVPPFKETESYVDKVLNNIPKFTTI